MNWAKLSLSQINEFLLMRNKWEHINFSLACNQAQDLITGLTPESDLLTSPVRDLIIASRLTTTGDTYRAQDIRDLQGSTLVHLSNILNLEVTAPESVPILKILSLANLLIDDNLLNLPFDILRMIGLKLDYDDLGNYLMVTKTLYTLKSSSVFWKDKIYHDFGQENCSQSYVKVATRYYNPVRGSENYAHSYRSLGRLLFNAGKLNKSTGRYIDKMHSLWRFDITGNLEIMGRGKGNRLTVQDKDSILPYTIGLILAHREKDISTVSAIKLDYCYNVAAAVRGDTILPKFPYYQSSDILTYAILFDNISIIREYITRLPGSYNLPTIVELGNGDTIQFFHDLDSDRFINLIDNLLSLAIVYHNTEAIPKLVELGAIITAETIENAIEDCGSDRDLLIQLLDLSAEEITTDKINNFLQLAAKDNRLIAANLFLERGGNINWALTGAAIGNHETHVGRWIDQGATELNEALIRAIQHGADRSVKILLQAGATNIDAAINTLIHLPKISDSLEDIMISLIDTNQINVNTIADRIIAKPLDPDYSDEDVTFIDILVKAGATNLNEMLITMIKRETFEFPDNYSRIAQILIASTQIDKKRAIKIATQYQNTDILNILGALTTTNKIILLDTHLRF